MWSPHCSKFGGKNGLIGIIVKLVPVISDRLLTTPNIHEVILVIDRNYDINDIVTAYLAKSLELYRDSGD